MRDADRSVKCVKGKGVKGKCVKDKCAKGKCVQGKSVQGNWGPRPGLDFPKAAATTTSISHPARGRRPTMQSVAQIFATSRLVSLAA